MNHHGHDPLTLEDKQIQFPSPAWRETRGRGIIHRTGSVQLRPATIEDAAAPPNKFAADWADWSKKNRRFGRDRLLC